jgi:hypothetical protein
MNHQFRRVHDTWKAFRLCELRRHGGLIQHTLHNARHAWPDRDQVWFSFRDIFTLKSKNLEVNNFCLGTINLFAGFVRPIFHVGFATVELFVVKDGNFRRLMPPRYSHAPH